MFSKRVVCVLLFYVFFINCIYAGDRPVVELNGSKVQGEYSDATFKDGTRRAKLFLGIPYAKPPVGELRFTKPEKLSSLPSLVKATEFKPGCLQLPRFGESPLKDLSPENQSEDCLYLNVFVPDSRPEEADGYAVMVWIHGGAFLMGFGDIQGKYLSTYGNVILVSLNYRLGIFGFLGTGDHHAPGNLGLWDQQLALQWVHENIAAFGGDNKRVTIFGESAGSISVMHQALYPPNKGLFQRVIAQSGAPSMKLLFQYNPLKTAMFYAEAMGCEEMDSKRIVECLQAKPAGDIVDVQNQLHLKGTHFRELGVIPYLDNDFIKLDPLNLFDLKENNQSDVLNFYRSLDIIQGVNSGEGIISYAPQFSALPVMDNPETFKPTRQQMDEDIIPAVANANYDTLNGPLLAIASSLYTDWSNPNCPDNLRHQLVKLIGDLIFVLPAVQYSQLHVNTSNDVNSYLYYLNAVPTKPFVPRLSWAKGANHGDDLGFVFHFRLSEDKVVSPADWEYDLSLDVMRYWANFAKSGNPNKPEIVKTTWPKYDMKEQKYLEIDKNMSENNVKKYFYAEEAEFWLKTIPSLRKHMATKPSEYLKGVQDTCNVDGECKKP